MTRIPVSVFFALFTVSGFAGLIYQSIWSHYLKLFLGHAAYAQTLVLAIFMGGMAIGSWLVSRYTARIRNMLVGYAIAELVIGLLAICFHGVFRAATGWAFDSALPALGGAGVDLFKWTLASLLILPASIMLGTTFPLMSAGIVRLDPGASGRALTMLYFTNSFGAAIGVLASGFLLIGRLGLPGTILVAGVMNILLAAAVWLIARRLPPAQSTDLPAPGGAAVQTRIDAFTAAILALALLTGAASFIYEITWIRMLTQALGASTHSFEVMLSAFILAMSLGALWFRDRIGLVQDRVAWLAGLLIAKAAFAVSALWVYGEVLDLVKWLVHSTSRTDGGYVIATAGGMIAAMLVMFPAAFCAGMTLPLATHALTASGRGEASIGRVYSANTAGCILGAFFSTHVGMELLGVKGLTGFGALVDAGVGVFLLLAFGAGRRAFNALAGMAVAGGILLFLAAPLDLTRMTSGVYRYGQFVDAARIKLAFYRDGKTATIAVMDDGPVRSIRTNGKPDASIVMDPKLRASVDEYTMVMAAALPLAFKPDARSVANIGLGSGLTTHALLGSPRIEVLDSVEIERMIVEGARLFLPRNARAFEDPRSKIHVEDAKTFFAAHQRRYDLIVSEPSNPWVSGISTLFSEEFYAHVRRYLNDDGVLVQWIQAYEIDLPLLSSVFAALGRHMGDYAVYTTGPDLLVVATPARRLPEPSAQLFEFPGLRNDLALLGVKGLPDLDAMRVGARFAIEPLFDAQRVTANSDFYPVLDQRAPLARFRRDHVGTLVNVRQDVAPVMSFFDRDGRMPLAHLATAGPNRPLALDLAAAAAEALAIARGGDPRAAVLVQEPVRTSAILVAALAADCTSADAWLAAVQVVAGAAVPFLRAPDVEPYFEHVRKARCWKALDDDGRRRIELLEAINARSAERVAALAVAVLDAPGGRFAEGERASYIASAIAASLVTGNLAQARQARDRHVPKLGAAERASMPLNIALAHLARFEGRR